MPDPTLRDPEETRAGLERWLASRRPAAAPPRVELHGGPGATGFSSDTLLFDALHPDGRRERLVARLEPSGPAVFAIYDVARQYRVLEALEPTPVPTPPLRGLETDPAVLGVPFFVMAHVEGQIPGDNPNYNAAGWVTELTPAERTELWWSGVDAMIEVHRLDWRALGLGFLDAPSLGATGLQQQLGYYEDLLDRCAGRERYPLLVRAEGYLRAKQPEGEPVRFCWGDSRPANQIFDGTRCAAVLDWEMAHLGNPVGDLGWWTGLDRCLTEGIGIARLPGLPSREETVARWQAGTGLQAEHLEYYELFAIHRFAVILARIGLQMKQRGILPADHDFDIVNPATGPLAALLDELGV